MSEEQEVARIIITDGGNDTTHLEVENCTANKAVELMFEGVFNLSREIIKPSELDIFFTRIMPNSLTEMLAHSVMKGVLKDLKEEQE